MGIFGDTATKVASGLIKLGNDFKHSNAKQRKTIENTQIVKDNNKIDNLNNIVSKSITK